MAQRTLRLLHFVHVQFPDASGADSAAASDPDDPAIHAAWLEGADALNRADEFSDLDLWLDVTPGQEDAAFQRVREVLETFGPLDVEQEQAHPHPMIQQRFYRSVGLPPFLFVDICVQTHGREISFGPADAFHILFDRAAVLKRVGAPETDVEGRVHAILGRRWRWILVRKEVERGQPLEALAYYHAEVLEPLTELLRLRYAPHTSGYGLKHVYGDLPRNVVRELEQLCELTGPDIPSGLERAGALVDALTAELVLPTS